MRLFSRKIKKETEEKAQEQKPKDAKKVQPKTGQPKVEEKETEFLSSAAVSQLITRPLLTEKAGMLEASGQYVFIVTKSANKSEVKKEIERLFNVKVESVNIINKKRKRRMWRGRVGFSSGFKKAIVTLAEGNKIEVLPK